MTQHWLFDLLDENKRLELENAQLRKLVVALREQRKTTTVEPPKVAERDIRSCFAKLGTNQAVVDFCNKHHIILPKNEYWYCINSKERTATIIGLETSIKAHGIPRITNGVVVWMELGNGELFLGHRDWLKYDRRTADLKKENERLTQKQKDE